MIPHFEVFASFQASLIEPALSGIRLTAQKLRKGDKMNRNDDD